MLWAVCYFLLSEMKHERIINIESMIVDILEDISLIWQVDSAQGSAELHNVLNELSSVF